MRSAPPSPDDLTARARIRDAAVQRFADDGFGVPLRVIAEDAGVSAPLVVHHFGSKDGLRAACDEHVLTTIAEAKSGLMGDGAADRFLVELAQVEEYGAIAGYVLRSVQHGGGLAQAFLEQSIANAQRYIAAGVASGTLRPSRDEAARARWLALQGLGAMVMDLVLDPAPDLPLGARVRRYIDRVALPIMETFTEGFFADRTLLDTYLGTLADPPADARP